MRTLAGFLAARGQTNLLRLLQGAAEGSANLA